MNAYIVGAVRTAAGRRKGALSHWHPAELGARAIDGLMAQVGIAPEMMHRIDDVIFGCVSQVGAQSCNVARGAVLSSALPMSVPATTVDRQCGSSQQAIHFAAQAVMSGTGQDAVIAGGVEVMSAIPIFSNVVRDGASFPLGSPNSITMNARYDDGRDTPFFSQFTGAELMCDKYALARPELEVFAADSHRKAAVATAEGRFRREIIAVDGRDRGGNAVRLVDDEGIRVGTTAEKLAELDPLSPGGRLTAGTASQISDGAAAVLVMNERGLETFGLAPRARVVALGLAASDPVLMLWGPVPATQTALARAELTIGDIDLFEVNEAFASVPLGWAKDVGADPTKLNVNGGACALGHPLGATGAKLMTTLLHELERTNARYGLQAICEGGGTANATIIERV